MRSSGVAWGLWATAGLAPSRPTATAAIPKAIQIFDICLSRPLDVDAMWSASALQATARPSPATIADNRGAEPLQCGFECGIRNLLQALRQSRGLGRGQGPGRRGSRHPLLWQRAL